MTGFLAGVVAVLALEAAVVAAFMWWALRPDPTLTPYVPCRFCWGAAVPGDPLDRCPKCVATERSTP